MLATVGVGPTTSESNMKERDLAKVQAMKARIGAIMDEIDDFDGAMTAAESEAFQRARDGLEAADMALVDFT